MSETITSGSWQPRAGHEDAFVEAWMEFAAWASETPGAGTLRLACDLRDSARFVSYGDWQSLEAVHAWKGSSEFRDRMARVLQHVDDFRPAELETVATARAAAAARESAALT
jgi:heme-degrading monooxygenase HmoA